ncbi:hypothetical protein L0668_12145 [Paraglaciecola aquimarina]|uniref:Heparinase II N-terminal domain-containing protein n=1 Tax=Paraglaciecola algarum TaxID=3050085 RepID=A0ABS9DA39_9ALTE|nr:hypothetical protein [Paraglaciecola sp. G1-23]MCF2948862.1 hypothetical protein [Paraglaciecola sp. G1-23]
MKFRNIKKRFSAIFTSSLLVLTTQASAEQTPWVPYANIPLEHINPSAEHPSLFFTEAELPAIIERSLSLPWLRETRKQIKNKADLYMQLSTTPWQLANEYNGIGTAGRGLQNYVGTLGFASYLFDEPKYLQKAKEILLAVVDQTEPNNRKHWRSHLQVSDATQGMVLGYDLVYPILSKGERQRALEEIKKFALELTHKKSAWGAPAPGVLSCNHSTVHYGALGLAALVLWYEGLPEAKHWMQRAIGRVDGYLGSFSDKTGYGTEGHHYYAYGLGGSSVFAWALKRSNGPDLIAQHPKLALAGDQVLWKVLPFEGRMLALNDNVETVPTDVAGMLGALTYNQPKQLWAWLKSLKDSDKLDWLGGNARTTYTTPFLFMWGDKPVAPIDPQSENYKLGHHFESGRVFARSSWQGEDAAHFSMTSGIDFHRGHDQQDENSVTFYAYGEGFLTDPNYEPERSEAHTTLRIDGVEQIKGGDGNIARYREDKYGALVVGQAEHAYDFDKTWVGYAERKSYFVRGPVPYLVFRDDSQVEHDRAVEVVSRYITYPNNTLSTDGDAAIIKGFRGKASARLMVFSEHEQIKVNIDDVSKDGFVNRGKEYAYKKYLKRLSATVHKVNPKLLSILIPFREKQDLPKVEVNFDDKSYSYTLTITFEDSHTDVLTITPYDIVLNRK